MPKRMNPNTLKRGAVAVAAGLTLAAVMDKHPSDRVSGAVIEGTVVRHDNAFDQLEQKRIGHTRTSEKANGDVTKVTVVKTPGGKYQFEQTRERRRMDGHLGPIKQIGAAALGSDGKVLEGATITAGKSYSDEWRATTTFPDGAQTHNIATALREIDSFIEGVSQDTSAGNHSASR